MSDCGAFFDFYNAIGGASLALTAANCCYWNETIVKCNSAGRVNWIAMNNMTLQGTLSESLGRLSMLGLLSLNSNPLTGPLPTSIGNLTNLSYLSLYNTNLNGTLPASFANLTKLKMLDLTLTSLRGPLPPLVANNVFAARYDGSSCPYPSSMCLVSGSIPSYCSASYFSPCPIVQTTTPATLPTVPVIPSPTTDSGSSDPFSLRYALPALYGSLILVCAIAALFFVSFGLILYFGVRAYRENKYLDPNDNAQRIFVYNTPEMVSAPSQLPQNPYIDQPHPIQYGYPQNTAPTNNIPPPDRYTIEQTPIVDPLTFDGPYYYDDATNAYYMIRRAESSVFGPAVSGPGCPPSKSPQLGNAI